MSRIGVNRVVNVLLLVIVAATAAATAASVWTNQTAEPEQSVVVGIQGVDDNGQIVTVDDSGAYAWQRTDAVSYHDITQLNDSHILAAFAVDEDSNCGGYEPPCGRTGFRIINQSSDEIEREWTFAVNSVPNSEVHDVEMLPSGEVVVADMDRERVFTVAKNGSTTWQWNASERYQQPADVDDTDWLHINDVDYLGDGRFLVSVRNEHQLVVLKRGDGVTELINKEKNTDVLDSQHNPQWLGDGRILVADSENNRVVELQRQSDGWTPVWSVTTAGGEQLAWPRDADRLDNGQTLITDSRNHRVVLVDENGTAVSEWETPKLPYDAELAGQDESVGGPSHNGTVDSPSSAEQAAMAPFELSLAAVHHTVGAPSWLRWWHFAAIGLLIVIRAIGDVAMCIRGDST